MKTKTCSLEQVLEISATEAPDPIVAAEWRDTAGEVGNDVLEQQGGGAHDRGLCAAAGGGARSGAGSQRRVYQLCVSPQGSPAGARDLVSRFKAFAFLNAPENGHQEVMRELLRPMISASTAMMGYVIATRYWRDRDPSAYPFVKLPANILGKDWASKLASTKSMLPAAGPIFRSGRWDLQGMPGIVLELHDCIRATYTIFL